MGVMNRKDYEKLKPGSRVKPVLTCGPSKTKQEFGKESNINYIMDRYAKTGQLPVGVQRVQPVFADVSTIGDFSDVLRRVTAAKEAFAQLPANVRARFHNQPHELVEFLQDGSNRDEAVKLGLIPPPPKVEAKVVPPVPLKTEPAPAK